MMPKHPESLVHFVHTDGLFSLLKVTHKPESKSGAQCKLLLRQSRSAPARLHKQSDRIGFSHTT